MKYLITIMALFYTQQLVADCCKNHQQTAAQITTTTSIVSSYKLTTQLSGRLLDKQVNDVERVIDTQTEMLESDVACNCNNPNLSLVYGHDKYLLTSVHKSQLKQFIQQIDSSNKIVVEGHADSTGKPDYNHLLSQRRAKQVTEYLKSHLTSDYQFVEHALGQGQPTCSWSENRKTGCNRRVFLFLKT